MPLTVTCRQCGQHFAVAPHLYGRRVRCTTCRAALDIPNPSDSLGNDVSGAGAARSFAQPQASAARSASSEGDNRVVLYCSLGAAATLLVLLAAVAAPRLFSSSEQTPPADETAASPAAAPAAAAVPAGEPLSDEEIIAWAEELEAKMRAGDKNAFSTSFDRRAMLMRATAPPPDDEDIREKFIDGMLRDWRSGKTKNLGKAIQGAIAGGGSYSFVHVHPVNGRKRALFRLTGQGGFNYHGFVLAKQAGRVRAVDIYVFSLGEFASQTMRRAYLPFAAHFSRGWIERLTKSENAYVKHGKDLLRLTSQIQSKQYAAALRTYRSLPEVLRHDKSIMLHRLIAAGNLDERTYADAIEDFRRHHPHDPALRLVLLDAYIIRKNYAEALRAFEELDRLVGGDPYLHIKRAYTRILQGDSAAAEKYLRRAGEENPDLLEHPHLLDAYWSLVRLALERQDHEETLRLLRLLVEEYGYEFDDLRTLPEYADFVRSPQYQRWLEFQNR